jgi:hypothetical protein
MTNSPFRKYARAGFVVMLVMISVTGCSSTSQPPDSDSTKNQLDSVVQPDTLQNEPTEPRILGTATVSEAAYVIDPQRSTAFVIDGDNLVVEQAGNDDLLDLESGTVLVGTAGKGFLRKVESVTALDGQVTISTSPATLEDLFDDANFTVELPMYGNVGKADSACPECAANPWINIDFGGTVLFEDHMEEGVHEKLCKGTITEGYVKFAPRFSFSYVKSFFSGLHFLSFTAGGYVEAAIALEFIFYSMQLEGQYELPLASKSFTLMAGSVPIIVTPQLSLVVDATALLQQGWGKVAGGMKASADFEMTVTWEKEGDPQWSGWQSGGFDLEAIPFEIDGSWFLEGKLTGAVKLKASLQVYDIAGPYVNIGPYTELVYKVDGTDDPDRIGQHTGGGVNYVEPFSWELHAGIDAGAGVEASVFGWDIFDYGRSFFKTNDVVAEGEIEFDTCEFEPARECFFAAEESHPACQAACGNLQPCPVEDHLCPCQYQACLHDCSAEILFEKSRCFDAHGCKVILASHTEASLECSQEATEEYANCLRTTPETEDGCGFGCDEQAAEAHAECLEFHYAGIVEAVLGQSVGN